MLTPKKLIDKDRAYFWTKEWQQAEIQVSEDIQSGRTRIFDSAKDLFKELGE